MIGKLGCRASPGSGAGGDSRRWGRGGGRARRRRRTRPAAPSWADFQKLEQELRDQRQLILQLMQNEQQRYDLLLKLIQTGGNAAQLPPARRPPKLAPLDAQLRPAAAVAEAGAGRARSGSAASAGW